MNNRLSKESYHNDIRLKLDGFVKKKTIPNIIFYGPSGSGKRTLIQYFISSIYNNNDLAIKSYVLYVNCAHAKGIKYVREDIKFFAKSNINVEGNTNVKIIIMFNADKLTTDAQSALRRCIEIFSNTTRFLMVVEDKQLMLKPILSRFCEIFVKHPTIENKVVNLHIYNIMLSYPDTKKNMLVSLKKIITPLIKMNDKELYNKLIPTTDIIYEKGYCGNDIIEYIKTTPIINELSKYTMLLHFNNTKNNFRNEKLFILSLLQFLFRFPTNIENISFM